MLCRNKILLFLSQNRSISIFKISDSSLKNIKVMKGDFQRAKNHFVNQLQLSTTLIITHDIQVVLSCHSHKLALKETYISKLITTLLIRSDQCLEQALTKYYLRVFEWLRISSNWVSLVLGNRSEKRLEYGVSRHKYLLAWYEILLQSLTD